MEGVKGLREAFNAVANPVFNCTLALLDYERKHDTEFQILTFRGNSAEGKPFTINSEDLRPGSDLGEACRETAKRLLAQEIPGP